MSMLDRSLGYNQVLMEEEDKYHKLRSPPHGEFYAFNRMSFGLKNIRFTF